MAFPPRRRLRLGPRGLPLLLSGLLLPLCRAFNLDVESPAEYSGPEGSYFGFAVDFFVPSASSRMFLLVGAPKANTTQPGIVEGGQVLKCDWSSHRRCQPIEFDATGNRDYAKDDPLEFKSHQWFGASVRSKQDKILACAPLYHWRTEMKQEREPVGTCFLQDGTKTVEYAPCRSKNIDADGQGFCQGGFSIDFTKADRVLLGGPGSFYWQGQLISDQVAEIVSKYDPKVYSIKYNNQLATRTAQAIFDDSYLGYSVAVGDFNGDGIDDFVSGVPRAARTLGMVYIYDGKNMSSLHNFTGEQMAAYFGFSVAATDINGDDYADVFIGAPLFMDRGSDGKLQEVGQVSVSLQKASGDFQTIKLNGFEVFARFGSAIAPLGDLDQDGFNDIAIAAPYGGEDKKGIVYIFNGRPTGLNAVPSQILEGKWAARSMPPSFGYSMKGATDIDKNGYPDLIVGAFGVDRAVLYRARPVITVNAGLEVYPSILNQENKTCPLPGTDLKVSCFNVRFCLKADGKGALPTKLDFQVELLLDKLKQKGAIRRALFLHNRSPGHSKNMTISRGGQMQCEELIAYLRDESEFRDKLTPITIFMEYWLDYRTAADATGLQPILNQFTPANVSRQAHILLDCGEDNVCKPKLEVSVDSDQKKIYIGDDNPLTLIVKAQNQGEGAYEAELIVSIPLQADFIGVVRNSEALARLSCAFKTENQTRQVVCDLGNPMKAGTQLLAGLRFSVHQQSEMDTSVKFDLQIQSSNLFDKVSPVVSYKVDLAVLAAVEIRGVSSPDHIFLPIPNWKYKENPETEEDVGPVVQHIYELRNNGPSSFSKAMLHLQWPYKYNNNTLLYILQYDIDGPMNCTSDMEINPLRIKISNSQTSEKNDTVGGQGDRNHLITKRDLTLNEGDVHTLGCGIAECLKIVCQVGRLDRGKSAILYVRSLLWTETFMNKENQNHSYSLKSSASFNVIEFPYKNLPIEDIFNSTLVTTNVTWGIQPAPMPVPVWVIILAVLAGLLLLAVLVFVMYRMGFFKRVRPPQEEQEREQLQPHENGEGNSET
uniref:Integrin alpha-V n=1 Tax=Bos taurus TaxID=9913 RepID=ITAV_BOVIN|nr:RecName: Full=Integrin alpha-V; AltName: Full=Vitronectin receptor subunit alpha; AltName: CD_antigen=CD51; Contains: RecName: Full=Integrin alpha-V heavy chain; Contains: RecName: Full=Integrin alpha-V light chain; Flags: Precursor [Bos taurus]